LKQKVVIAGITGSLTINRTKLELKLLQIPHPVQGFNSINRTKLELKRVLQKRCLFFRPAINRTKLELKLSSGISAWQCFRLSIVPNWNWNSWLIQPRAVELITINRTKLELKPIEYTCCYQQCFTINRTKLELKHHFPKL